MFFSIIVPGYNAEKYIKRAVESVLGQSFQDYELILVDDGSTDATYNILEKYANSDKRVKTFHIENGGVSHARNTGIDAAKGEYLLFLDADDMYKENALEVLHNVCLQKEPDFLTFGYEQLNQKLSVHHGKEGIYDEESIRSNLLQIVTDDMFGAVWSKVYRASIVKAHHVRMDENLYLGEDYCFNLQMLRYSSHFQVIEEALYVYIIQNQQSIIKSYKKDKFEQMYRMHQIRTAFIKQESRCDDLANAANVRMNFIRLCISCFMDLSRKECPFSFREKLQFIKRAIDEEPEQYQKGYLRYLSFGKKVVYHIFETKNAVLILLFSKLCYVMKFKAKLRN